MDSLTLKKIKSLINDYETNSVGSEFCTNWTTIDIYNQLKQAVSKTNMFTELDLNSLIYQAKKWLKGQNILPQYEIDEREAAHYEYLELSQFDLVLPTSEIETQTRLKEPCSLEEICEDFEKWIRRHSYQKTCDGMIKFFKINDIWVKDTLNFDVKKGWEKYNPDLRIIGTGALTYGFGHNTLVVVIE